MIRTGNGCLENSEVMALVTFAFRNKLVLPSSLRVEEIARESQISERDLYRFVTSVTQESSNEVLRSNALAKSASALWGYFRTRPDIASKYIEHAKKAEKATGVSVATIRRHFS